VKQNNVDKQTILLVDDKKDNLRILQITLEPLGYAILAAPSGEVALKIAEKARPDLVLLDVMMPGIDGFETLRRLKTNAATRSLPVIFITAKTDPVDVERFFAAGAVDYIRKPFCQKKCAVACVFTLCFRGSSHRRRTCRTPFYRNRCLSRSQFPITIRPNRRG